MLNIELRFRAFNKKTQRMYKSGPLSFSKQQHSFRFYSDTDMEGLKDEDMELMQFTGQKDKNNRDVYQRDVIMLDEKKYIVVWDNNRGGWSYTDVERQITLTPFGRSEANNCEVIGNQFENPELLKP